MIDKWRVGRKVGRTIYLNNELVGLMDTTELAARVVGALIRQELAHGRAEGRGADITDAEG